MATSALLVAGGGRLSRSTTVVMGAVSGRHIFRLKGYSQAKALTNGQYMTLGAFDVGGHSWGLQFYPNGQGSDDKDYISFFLTRDRDLSCSGMPARFAFSLLGQDGKPAPSYGLKVATSPFNKAGYGSRKFMRREVFEKSECLKDDSFAIQCEVSVAATEPSTVKDTADAGGLADPPPAIVATESGLQKDLADLLRSKQGADVTIEAGGETFHAHKWLLAARSPEFKDRFFGSMQKKAATAHIQIDDVEPQVFKSLLHFMYTDTVPKMEDDEALSKMAACLLAAADRYKLEKLKTMCEEMLCKRVDMTTVEASLVLCEQHHCPALKATCMEFLTSPGVLKAIMDKDGGGGFESLNKSCRTVVLELAMKKLLQLGN